MMEKFVAMDAVFCLFTFIRHPKFLSVRVGSLTMYIQQQQGGVEEDEIRERKLLRCM